MSITSPMKGKCIEVYFEKENIYTLDTKGEVMLTIMSILQNEKYKGDALLQKTYTVDFLSKTIKKNNGEITQYYIQNSHPAIIDPDTFELVQAENARQIQDQAIYNRQYSELRTAYEETETGIADRNKKILVQLGRKEQIRRCLNDLRRCGDILDEFDLSLWNTLVEAVTVFEHRTPTFRFRDGTEVSAQMPEKKQRNIFASTLFSK